MVWRRVGGVKVFFKGSLLPVIQHKRKKRRWSSVGQQQEAISKFKVLNYALFLITDDNSAFLQTVSKALVKTVEL